MMRKAGIWFSNPESGFFNQVALFSMAGLSMSLLLLTVYDLRISGPLF